MLWKYTDNVGVERLGYVERTSDFGGSDITYYVRRATLDGEPTPGALDVLSGTWMKQHGACPIAYSKEA